MKSDELANELQEIANQLEKCRLKIFQTPKCDDEEDIDYVDNRLFSLQSQIRDVSENVKYMFFEEDWK